MYLEESLQELSHRRFGQCRTGNWCVHELSCIVDTVPWCVLFSKAVVVIVVVVGVIIVVTSSPRKHNKENDNDSGD